MNNYYKQKARWEILNKKREERKLAKEYKRGELLIYSLHLKLKSET